MALIELNNNKEVREVKTSPIYIYVKYILIYIFNIYYTILIFNIIFTILIYIKYIF